MNFLEVRNWIGEELESRSQMPNILALPGEKRADPIDEMRDALKYSLD